MSERAIRFLPEADRARLLEYAVRTSQPVNAVIAAAVREFLAEADEVGTAANGGSAMTGQLVYIRRKVGRCPACGAPLLDSGYSDDPELWEHAIAAGE